MTTVDELMTPEPLMFPHDADVATAARAMRDGDVGDVLVHRGGQLQGIVTDRDIVVRVVADGLDPVDVHVGAIATRTLHTLEAGTDVAAALEVMRDAAITRVPIVDDGRPVGVLTLGDVALARDPGSVLGEVSAATPNE